MKKLDPAGRHRRRPGLTARFRVALVLLCALPMQGSGTLVGKISGSVRGEYGKTSFLLPKVTVTLTFTDHGRERETLTDDDGEFFFSNLALGNYTVKPSLDGYLVRAPKVAEVRVHVDETEVVLPPFRLVRLGRSVPEKLDPGED